MKYFYLSNLLLLYVVSFIEFNPSNSNFDSIDNSCPYVAENKTVTLGESVTIWAPCDWTEKDNMESAIYLYDKTKKMSATLKVVQLNSKPSPQMLDILLTQEGQKEFLKSAGGGNVISSKKIKISGLDGVQLVIIKYHNGANGKFYSKALLNSFFHDDHLINITYSVFGYDSSTVLNNIFSENYNNFALLSTKCIIAK